MGRRPRLFRRPPVPHGLVYRPYEEVAGRPHVVADGPPTDATALTLSHWPGTPTPARFRADLSATSAFLWLERARRTSRLGVVTNDHLDQDGLVAVFALVDPERALEHRTVLEEVAAAGDFATARAREPARLCFALATLADPDRSPLPAGVFRADYGERCAALYEELLGRLPELVERPGRARALWAEEDAALEASIRALRSGAVDVEEVPEADLAVVTVREPIPGLATRFCHRVEAWVHPAALYGETSCLRVLFVCGRRYRLVQRYESWVRLVSRPVAPRVDLAPLAAALEADERGGCRWHADPAGALEAELRTAPGCESSLEPARVLALTRRHLLSAPPAWGPHGPLP
jgi:hypothetical protein